MLKIIYAGTPEFAVPSLKALSNSDHEIIAVYTQPDRPAGRGRQLQPGPVKQVALDLSIPVFQPHSFKQESDQQQLKDLQADLMVVAAYGLILPAEILEAPRLGCVNIHASLLPRWRGAAPIQRALLAGDIETGITIMQMDTGLDTGDMLAKQAIAIDPDWNSGELHDELMQAGADLLILTIEQLVKGELKPEQQDESQVSYAEKLVKSEAAIDWSKDAKTLQREVRAYAPWPVSFTQLDGKSLRIWRANALDESTCKTAGLIIDHNKKGLFVACGSGVLQLIELQFAGKNKSTPAQILNARNLKGLIFG